MHTLQSTFVNTYTHVNKHARMTANIETAILSVKVFNPESSTLNNFEDIY